MSVRGDRPAAVPTASRRCRVRDSWAALAGRGWVLPVVVLMPALVALVVGLWVRSGGDERTVHLYAPLWVTIGTVGLLATAAVGGAAGLWSTYRRYTGGYAQAVSTQVQRARRQWSAESWMHRTALLSRLRHELEEPATAVRLSVAAWADTAGSRSAAVATEQAERVTRLATNLGALLDAETADLDMRPVPLVPLVERAVARMRGSPALRGPDPVVDVETSPTRLVVRGEEQLLSAVVHHLVANAVKFSPPEATVNVRCAADGDAAVLEVVDTGPGIPAAEVDLVWELLARGASAADVPGSGLGLPLVRAVVERHGGTVVMSSHLGEGTSVRVRLPLERQPDDVPPGLLPERAGDQGAPRV